MRLGIEIGTVHATVVAGPWEATVAPLGGTRKQAWRVWQEDHVQNEMSGEAVVGSVAAGASVSGQRRRRSEERVCEVGQEAEKPPRERLQAETKREQEQEVERESEGEGKWKGKGERETESIFPWTAGRVHGPVAWAWAWAPVAFFVGGRRARNSTVSRPAGCRPTRGGGGG
jgi:hypothetical protein